MKRIIPVMLLISGCATSPEAVKYLADAQRESAKMKTIEMECSGPCKVSYTDPRDRPQIRMPTNGWDAAIAVTREAKALVSGTMPYAAVGYAIHQSTALGTASVEAMRDTKHGDVITTSGDTFTRGDESHVTTTTTNTETNSGQAGNSGTIYGDVSGRLNSDDDYTSEPTVVEQPAPVITAPEVVVVPSDSAPVE